MRKAIFIVMGAILAVGIAFAQTDPWWHPLNPQGGSAGVTYGTALPTTVNTGYPPTDGLLAVQITSGAIPNLQIYDQSTASWLSLMPGGAAGALTDDTVPVWDAATNAFIDSGIVDDAVTITITSATDTIIPIGQLELGDGLVIAAALSFLAEDDSGLYRIGADNIGLSMSAALVMDWEDTNAAGAGADLVTISSTLGIMNDAADVVRGLAVALTNVNHTGGDVYGIDILALAGTGADVNADEYAINFEALWDQDIRAVGSLDLQVDTDYFFDIAGEPNVLVINNSYYENDRANGSLVTIGGDNDMGAGNGGDTYRVVHIDFNNALTHSGVGNVVVGLGIDAITGDAQARETGIDIETGFDVGISSTQHIFQRENFQQGFRKQLAADFTAATDGDGDVNIVLGTNGVNFEYREELAKATSSFILDGAGSIDISADNTTVNEGVEFMLGSSQTTTSGYLIAQTDQLCFSANITITLIAGTDQVSVGWRANEAYEAANIYTNYGDYNVVAVNNVDGSVFGLSDSTTGAAETDDSTTNWANGETKTLKACIDGAGLPHGYLDGVLIIETNRTTAIDADIMMVPFVTYMQAGGAVDAAVLINWWEITAN